MTTSACSSIAGSKTKRKELKWVTLQRGGKNIRLFELPGGYKQFREIHGRQTGFVDFTFTGKMMGSIHILSNPSQHSQGVVVIGPNTDEEQKKMAGNEKRKGEILNLSDSEIKEIADMFKVDTLKVFRDNGL